MDNLMQTLAEYLKESQNNSRLNKDNFLSIKKE